MKRLFASLSLLLALIALGSWNTYRLGRDCRTISGLLEQAQAAGEAGDWGRAEELTRSAQEFWDGETVYLHIVLHHDYTDDIYTGLREVRELIRWKETPEYASANGKLIAQLEHMRSSERMTLENLL